MKVRLFSGSLYIEEKIEEIKKAEATRSNDVTDAKEPEGADLLTYLLSKESLSLEQVFSNVNEILLSGIDTVRCSHIRTQSQVTLVLTSSSSSFRLQTVSASPSTSLQNTPKFRSAWRRRCDRCSARARPPTTTSNACPTCAPSLRSRSACFRSSR